MLKKYLSLTIVLAFSSIYSSFAQNKNGYINPMAHTVILSSNFAELRPNHFHSGIDYKTEQTVNKPIRSIADGYVARFGISGAGYGNALYIAHPATGETSVYAHLNSFNPTIDSIVKAYQYEHRTFACNIYLKMEDAPVKQGEIVAYSGNTGSSGGPHLHFEIRNTITEECYDPLSYRMGVSDNVKPKFLQLKVYPQKDEGALNGSSIAKKYTLTTTSGVARFAKPATITAWGEIGLGIKCYDYTNGASNILGVRTVRLFVDGVEIYHYRNAAFSFDETRYINSLLDYEEYKKSRNVIMRNFVEEGNFLSVYENVVNQGFITIDEEREYQIEYIIGDSYGNESTFNFLIKGKKSDIVKDSTCNVPMPFDEDNTFEHEDVKVSIPKNYLYSDICFDYQRIPSTAYYSDIHKLHSEYVPLHNFYDIDIKLNKSVPDSSKLCAVRMNAQNAFQNVYIGRYEQGRFRFQARDFGYFALRVDTIPPAVTPVSFVKSAGNPFISFRIGDNLSGVHSYNGYIDDHWVLFQHDSKTNQIRYNLTTKEVTRGKQHQFRLVVVDAVGNETVYTRSFYW